MVKFGKLNTIVEFREKYRMYPLRGYILLSYGRWTDRDKVSKGVTQI